MQSIFMKRPPIRTVSGPAAGRSSLRSPASLTRTVRRAAGPDRSTSIPILPNAPPPGRNPPGPAATNPAP